MLLFLSLTLLSFGGHLIKPGTERWGEGEVSVHRDTKSNTALAQAENRGWQRGSVVQTTYVGAGQLESRLNLRN
jgi:hypothetical protein